MGRADGTSRARKPGEAEEPGKERDGQGQALRRHQVEYLQILFLALVGTWTLTTLREKMIKMGAKAGCHTRAVTYQLAKVAVPRATFAAILARIGRLRTAPSPG